MEVKAKIHIDGCESNFPGKKYRSTGSYLVDRMGIVWVETQKKSLFRWKTIGFVCEDRIEFYEFYKCGGDNK